MNKIKLFSITFCVITILSGCTIKTGDDLLSAPKPSEDYIVLQKQLDKELSTGKVFSAPEAGTNRNTVQLVDLDADSDYQEEVVAFFRETAISGSFDIVIYKNEGDEYIEMGRIDGHGSSIDAVEYPRLADIGAGGIAVSWKISNQLEKGLTVAKVENGEINVVLDTQYMHYFIADTNYDGLDEVFIISRSNDRVTLKMYEINGSEMVLSNEVDLSSEIDSVAKVSIGEMLSSGISIAIDSRVVGEIGLITDVISLKNGKFTNLTINDENTSSMTTYRGINSYSTKLFNSNILYIPTVIAMRDSDMDNLATISYITNWTVYDLDNPTVNDLFTYHNISEGWYFDVSAMDYKNLVIERTTLSDVRVTKFSHIDENSHKSDIFEIYVVDSITYNQTQFGSEFINLGTDYGYVYLAKNLYPDSIYRLGDNTIVTSFSIIKSEG